MDKVAGRSSWRTLGCPVEREEFQLPLVFTDDQAERIMRGHIPQDMDDRWFIFFEESWLYFHRSWTGVCIFGLRLDGSPAGVRVIDAWASRDRTQYNSHGLDDDKALIQQLIASRLSAAP